MWGLEVSQNPAWDWIPHGQDLNTAKPHSLPRLHISCVNPMGLRVLMSHSRKNSVRDKVLGKKCIYLDRNTHHSQCMGCCRGQVWSGKKFVLGHSNSKESACNAKDPGLIPGLGRSPGEENGYLLPLGWEIS